MLGRIAACLSLMIFLGIEGFGQNEFSTIQLPSRYTEDYWIVPDNQGNICVQYYKKPNVHFVVINKEGEEVTEIRHPFRYKPTLFAGNFSNGTFQFYYEPRKKKKEGDVAAFVIDAEGEKLKEQMRYDLRASNSEVFIGNFSDNKAVYSIISVRGSNTIRIANLNGEKDPEINTYNAPTLLEKEFRNQDPFLFVNPLSLKSIYNYQANKKVYFIDGNLYFTFDSREQFKTNLWKINLSGKTSELISIPQKKLVFGRSSNSFLHQNQLYRFTVDPVKIDLSIYDINGRDSVVSLSHTGDGQIPFQTGTTKFIDEYGAQHVASEMKNDKLFKTFSNGNPSLFVERINNNNVKVTMGAFNETASGLSIGGGFGSFGRSGGISIGGSKQLTGTKRGTTFIHSYLSVPELVVSTDDDLLTANERIFRYLDKNRRSIYSSKVYSYNEQTVHLAYVDPNEAKLKIVEFSK